MKSPLKKSIGEVVTDYGTKVMRIMKKRLQRSLFDFYGDVKADNLRTREAINAPTTPVDGDGGVIYTKSADGKLYYKSNEVAEVELSASDTVLTTEQVQDIAGPLVATGGTKTGITITYDDANNDMDFVVDHDAATNYVAEEHYRWDNDIQSTATINHANLSSDTGSDGEVLVVIDGDAVWGHPEKIHLQVRNDEGATIPAGAPLYSKIELGGSGRLKVGICDANDPAKMPCIGLAEAEMNTTSTKDNFAITQGIYNTNISGFTGLAVGDTLYVDTSGSAPYLTQTKPTGESSLIQNVGIVVKTNGTICQGLQVSAIGRTNDVPNLNSGYIFYGNGSNQAASTQLSTLLPPDLTVDGAGTIHVNNVPTLNQSTTGNAATATLATNAQGITGATDGDVTITSDGEVTVKLDSDNDESLQKFKITDNSDAVVFSVDEGGAIFTSGSTISNTGSDNDLQIQSDGNMTFVIDRDNDETSQSFSFKNFNVEVANLDESGNLQIDGTLELGHASDTTIARSAAGKVSIEGDDIQTQGEKIGQYFQIKIKDLNSYMFYMYNDDYWYSAGSGTLAILGLSTAPSAISSANSEYQSRTACYTAVADCTVKKLQLTFYWSSSVVNSADIDFAFSKFTPITDGTAASITMNAITATDHNGSYTENKPYQKTFTFSGANASLSAGDALGFHMRTTGGSSAQRVFIYGTAILSVELD